MPALFVSLVLLVAATKKAKNAALVVGTQQNLSNLDFLYISMDVSHEVMISFLPLCPVSLCPMSSAQVAF
jgi:hypothetical protein